MKPGINYGIPASIYHAHPAVSKSKLDLLARSPAHLHEAPPQEETRPKLIGSATHTAILEPGTFPKRYQVIEEAYDRRCKAWNDGVKTATVPESGLLTGPEGVRISTMARAVRGNPHIGAVLNEDGDAEVSVLTKDPETGLEVRIRIDWLTKSLRALDLKTTSDLRNDKFLRSVWDYRYHVQQAFYEDVFEWATGERLQWWRFAAIESDVPHVSTLVQLPPDLVQCGRILYRRDLNRYAECLEKGIWPGPHPEPFTLELTPWAMNQMEDIYDEALFESVGENA